MWDAGRGLTLIPGEVSEQDHCRDIMQQAVAEFGRPDILVNNAAMRRIHRTYPMRSSLEPAGSNLGLLGKWGRSSSQLLVSLS